MTTLFMFKEKREKDKVIKGVAHTGIKCEFYQDSWIIFINQKRNYIVALLLIFFHLRVMIYTVYGHKGNGISFINVPTFSPEATMN